MPLNGTGFPSGGVANFFGVFGKSHRPRKLPSLSYPGLKLSSSVKPSSLNSIAHPLIKMIPIIKNTMITFHKS